MVSLVLKKGFYEFIIYDDRAHTYPYCVTNDKIKRKYECVSKYDVRGKNKGKDVWDSRCKTDDDCPFYKANKNYPNTRGGCYNGYCEMPLGVERKGYKQYRTIKTAFCYNCNGKKNPNCCEEQVDRLRYPKLKSPDFVFKMDELPRRNYFGH